MHAKRVARLLSLSATLLTLALFAPRPELAYSATLVVTTVADDNGTSAPNCLSGSGPCTLRGALAAASSGDTITFNTTGTILLSNGTLALTKNVTIQGPGMTLLTVDGQNAVRVFTVNSGAQATLAGLAVRHGRINIDDGGGIMNDGGTLTVTNSSISDSFARNGGAIYNRGTFTVINSTLSANTAANDGGGIINVGTGTIMDSTINGNSGDTSRGVSEMTAEPLRLLTALLAATS
jgi:CSLREA domain-containing protein